MASDHASDFDHPDAQLIYAGWELDKNWQSQNLAASRLYVSETTENDDAWSIAYEKTKRVVRLIERLPARSLDGLRIKARAIEWYHSGEGAITFSANPTADMRIAAQIVQSLLGMGRLG